VQFVHSFRHIHTAPVSAADVPLLFSTSYGEDEDSTTQETADRTNIEFMKVSPSHTPCPAVSNVRFLESRLVHEVSPCSSPAVTLVLQVCPPQAAPATNSSLSGQQVRHM
jgi:hypothetical protein